MVDCLGSSLIYSGQDGRVRTENDFHAENLTQEETGDDTERAQDAQNAGRLWSTDF